MTVPTIKYSQVVWACIILDAASSFVTTKLSHPVKNHTYEVQEEQGEIRPPYQSFPLPNERDPPKLGLFVAQPSEMKAVFDEKPDLATVESRHRINNKYRRPNKYRSFFSHANRKYPRKKSRIETAGSDQYLTPEFVKFKNEIDIQTDRTHAKGMKMSRDNLYSPTIVYENPNFEKFGHLNSFHQNQLALPDESYRRPAYNEPSSDHVGGPSHSDSYNSYSPHSSSYPSSYSFSSSGAPSSSSNFDSSEITYPPLPPLPPSEHSNPSSYYEPDYKSPDYTNNDFSTYSNDDYSPNTESKEHTFPHNYNSREDETEADYPIPPNNSKWISKPKPFSGGKYKAPFPGIYQSQRTYKPFRGRRKGGGFQRTYKGPPSATPESQAEDEGQDLDTNDRTPSDPFMNDENTEEEEEDEEDDEVPKGKLRQSIRKRERKIKPSASQRRHCVRKEKEISDDVAEDDFGNQMSCLVCENLDTGNTYETCNYVSDPEDENYVKGNAASYKTKGRYKRAATEKKGPSNGESDTTDSVDYDSDNFEEEDEDQQEEEDDMAEFKPQPPAYANDDSCVEVKKKGATCMVCENPESNGKYEQCSYDNDPGEDSYEYAQTSRYGKSSSQETPQKKSKRPRRTIKNTKKSISAALEPNTNNITDTTHEMNNQTVYTTDETILEELQDLRDVEQDKIKAVNDIFLLLIKTKKNKTENNFLNDLKNPTYEKKFLNFFPHLNSTGNKTKRSVEPKHRQINNEAKRKINTYPNNEVYPKAEMTEIVEQFFNKDHSKCIKKMKNKMTCFICEDKDGTKREECMYMIKNTPKKVSYQESTDIKKPNKQIPEGDTKKPVLKYRFRPTKEMAPSPSLTKSMTIPKPSKSYSNVEISYTKDSKPNSPVFKRYAKIGADSEPITSNKEETSLNDNNEEETESEDPEETGEYKEEEVNLEADPSSPNGAFSDETRSIFDPQWKTSLPKFMVDKSEHEEMIDEFMSKL